MRRTASCLACLVIVASCWAQAPQTQPTLNTTRIEQLTGLKGTLDKKENVFKVSLPRNDVDVVAGGVKMTPPLGLTCWAAFQNAADHTMVMGDMVLLEDQVNPVMDAALGSGLEVTAIHNHFFWDSPKVMFVHIGGMGGEEQLASAVGKVFAMIKQTSGGKGVVPRVDIDPAKSTLDGENIEKIIGVKGQMTSGVYKVTIGRTTTMHGVQVGNAMGINTWAAFAGSDDKAIVDGDFVMYEPEVQNVLKALRSAGINIVALHNHMLGESPRAVFLHFWGVGSTEQLAKGIKAALDTQRRE